MGVLLSHTARRFDGIGLKIAVILAFTVSRLHNVRSTDLTYTNFFFFVSNR